MSEGPYLRLVPEPVSRSDLRRARRRDVVVYRVRMHLDDSDPPIWRRLDLRSSGRRTAPSQGRQALTTSRWIPRLRTTLIGLACHHPA